ncbi:MAG: ribosome-associated GTPase EngA [Thermoleophilia bacterium]|nr:ribosome-associated GTPase EngA [Thermoleophilia bacterium]
MTDFPPASRPQDTDFVDQLDAPLDKGAFERERDEADAEAGDETEVEYVNFDPEAYADDEDDEDDLDQGGIALEDEDGDEADSTGSWDGSIPEGLQGLDAEDAEWIAAELAEQAELEADSQVQFIGRVAVVGYPNVGKSTLVNRLSGTRIAIVHETPGVTRDRKEIECDWNGSRFLLIDTGGVDESDRSHMAREIVGQVEHAIAECDVVLLVVDGQEGVSAADHELAEILRKSKVKTRIVANKVDNVRHENEAAEFFELGLGMPIPVSAHHGNNTGDLLDVIIEDLTEIGTTFSRDDDEAVRIALVGRPNVGKSTLANAILGGADRHIVADMPGTTRDSVDTRFEFEGREVILVDTAGLRRRRSGQDPLDYYSEVRALQAADRADVAILLVDASMGVRENDLAVADAMRERDCATIVALAKWDINDVDLLDVTATITQKLRQRPEVVTTSGIENRNIHKLLRKAIELHDRATKRVGTGEFNRVLKELKERTPPPLDKKTRRRLNLLYGTQIQAGPPKFRVYVNDKGLMTRSYGYYLENQLRERFGFEGCPLNIEYRSRA